MAGGQLVEYSAEANRLREMLVNLTREVDRLNKKLTETGSAGERSAKGITAALRAAATAMPASPANIPEGPWRGVGVEQGVMQRNYAGLNTPGYTPSVYVGSRAPSTDIYQASRMQGLLARARLAPLLDEKDVESVRSYGRELDRLTSRTKRHKGEFAGVPEGYAALGKQMARTRILTFQLASGIQDIAVVLQGGGGLGAAARAASNNLGLLFATAGTGWAIGGTALLIGLTSLLGLFDKLNANVIEDVALKFDNLGRRAEEAAKRIQKSEQQMRDAFKLEEESVDLLLPEDKAKAKKQDLEEKLKAFQEWAAKNGPQAQAIRQNFMQKFMEGWVGGPEGQAISGGLQQQETELKSLIATQIEKAVGDARKEAEKELMKSEGLGIPIDPEKLRQTTIEKFHTNLARAIGLSKEQREAEVEKGTLTKSEVEIARQYEELHKKQEEFEAMQRDKAQQGGQEWNELIRRGDLGGALVPPDVQTELRGGLTSIQIKRMRREARTRFLTSGIRSDRTAIEKLQKQEEEWGALDWQERERMKKLQHDIAKRERELRDIASGMDDRQQMDENNAILRQILQAMLSGGFMGRPVMPNPGMFMGGFNL